ncbi:MAG: TonB-dependent receptor plug domain-containing protein [Holophagaceae bacterium]|nr:TonB-dependent receptor plug domain-containing protein [Holophagaceae bacterium]
MNSKILFLIVGSVFASSWMVAKPLPTEDEEKKNRDTREVPSATVTIIAEADTIEVNRTPNPVIVVTAEKLEKVGSNNLAKILELTFPGRVISLGGQGTQTSLFINGARSKDSIVLLDGIRLSDNNLGLSISNFMLTGVDRVEILGGPASTLYGADAHGGVVSMSSQGPSGTGLSGYLLGQGSTLGQVRAGAMASFGWDKGWVQGGGDSEQCPQAIKTKNPYRQASGYVGFGHQIGEAWLFTANHRSSYIGAPTPYDDDGDWPANKYFNDKMEALMWQSITTASIKGNFSNSFYGELNIGSISQENINDANTIHSSSPKLDRNQGNARTTWRGDKASVTFLGDFISEKLRNDLYNPTLGDWGGMDYNVISSCKHTAFALEGAIEPLPILRLVGSVRQQWDVMSPYKDADTSMDQTTWKAGVNLLLPTGFRSYVSTGTSFNTANIYEINSNIHAGMPAPGNEKSRSILAGVGYESNNKWWMRADASRINYSESLQWAFGASGLYYFNIYDIRVQGLEIAGGMKGTSWTAEIWARSQEGRKLDEPEESQLLVAFQRRPFFSGGLRANWAKGIMNFGADISYIGHRYDYPHAASAPSANKTHYVDCSLQARVQINKSLFATLRAERLFQDGLSREDWELGKDKGRNNVGYAEGYPSQGHALSLEVRYKF